MSKNSKILLIIIAVLVIAILVTAYLNKDDAAMRNQLNADGVFIVSENGEELKKFTMDEIKAIGEVDFKANYDSSETGPIPYTYTGVLMKNILKEAGVNLEGKEVITVNSSDGYTVAVDMKKVLDDDNVYLAYMREGESIGTREDGGDGPYEMIISKDEFSQYWCKYALTVDVE